MSDPIHIHKAPHGVFAPSTFAANVSGALALASLGGAAIATAPVVSGVFVLGALAASGATAYSYFRKPHAENLSYDSTVAAIPNVGKIIVVEHVVKREVSVIEGSVIPPCADSKLKRKQVRRKNRSRFRE